MAAPRIAVIGFGFSGLMVTANLVRLAAPETTLYIIDEDTSGQGLAYSTRHPEHLLNVPAAKMGAFPDALDGFFQWLTTAEAALAKQQLGLTKDYTETDFVPRALYAAYLTSIWQETQALASERHIFLKLVESRATAIQPGAELAVLTARGDAIAVDDVVLATGNETKPVMPHLPMGHVVQNPWAKDAFADAAQWPSPVMLMGVGLTAVDVVLMLRRHHYEGEIVAFSRNGLMPEPHQSASRIFAFDKDTLLAETSLAATLRTIRTAITSQADEWRVVIDALRPYTQTLWQRFSAREKNRFLRQLSTLWNVHRHRMAPEIANRIATEIAAGTLRIVANRRITAAIENDQLRITLGEEAFTLSHLINCTGPQLDVAKSATTLLKQAVADGVVEVHGTGLGIAADPQLRAWGHAYPHVYAMGGLLTGQLLESTAVPELRTQAANIARALVG